MLQELLKSSRGGQLLQGETLAVAPSEHISLRAKLCLAFACFLTATLLCLVPLHSAYASNNSIATVDGIDYTYEDDTSGNGVVITAVSSSKAGVTASVPATLDSKPVVKFGKYAEKMSLTGISGLDLSACADLTYVYVSNATSQIASLKVANCSKLTTLYCQDIGLTSLDLTGCSSLSDLYCSQNKLSSLGLQSCTKLKQFMCWDNQLTSLDLSKCSSLSGLGCQNNRLTQLDLGACPNLISLQCQSNEIASLDLSANKKLTQFDCSDNRISADGIASLKEFAQANNMTVGGNWNVNVAIVEPQKGQQTEEPDPTKTSISGCNVASIANQSYTGAALTPKPLVKLGSKTLVEGTDYTLSYKNNTNAGTATVTVTGKGDYTGIKNVTFKISAKNISGTSATVSNQGYTGKVLTPAPVVKNGSVVLKSGTDYTVAYKNNTKVGTATVTITGKGNYTGTKALTFKINAKSISGATVTVSDQNHTGKALTPAPTVKFGSSVLKSGTDYTLSYKNNINAGTATITIIGKGNYSGTKIVTFKIKTKEGWQKSGNRWWYKNSDGTYPKNCAKVIAGKTYRFDASGYMKTGWAKEGSSWYYHDASGVMAKGWKKLGSKWYYLDPSDGKMKTGFFMVGSSKYYANNDGVMQTGWKSISNKWYYFNTSGDMAKGWKSVSGKWYYLDPTSGVMKTGWFEEKGNKYYFISSGAMATGWQKVSDSWYYFKSSGAMAKGWINSNSKWYYLDDNGVMVTEKYQVKNDTYLLASSGVMQTGWQKEGSDWFYYNKSTGAMAKDAWVGNYWLNSDGVMAKNAWVDNGKYYVSTTGAYASNRRAKTAVKLADGYYRVKSSLGNVMLDMSKSSVDMNGNAQIWTSNNADAQVWKFTNMGNDYYRITNGNSNLALDVYCGNSADGTNVRQWEWNGSGAQLWKIYQSKHGGYVLVNKATGKALDVSGASSKPGTNVQIWTENDTKAQSWSINKDTKGFKERAVTNLSGQTFMFKTNVGSRYLDMSAASKANGGNAQLWGNTNSNAQVWKLEKQSGDYYRIVNVNSNKVLDVNAGNKANGTNVQQYQWNGSGAQLWKAYRSLYGGYVFVNKATGKALDVSGGVNKDGANVQIWDRNDTRAQTWHLESKKPFTSNTTSSSNKTLMNSEQYTLAKQIFDSYNNYRSSKGLAKVTWDDSYANMAYNSAKGCASRGALVHNLGIPANQRGNHSDILQYTTWKGEANDLVQRWKASDGHRKMMQCTSAKKAAVGVYKASNGVWYYAIVYDWRGTNHNGY